MPGNNLPPGWEDRNNQMSEHDMKLGGIAATKFASKKSLGAYDADDTGSYQYKNSDEVKQYYMAQIEAEEKEKQQNELQNKQPSSLLSSSSSSALPPGWEQRQKSRAVEEKQYGVFAKEKSSVPPPKATSLPKTNDDNGSKKFVGAEVALVQVATNTLDTLARTLEHHPTSIPMEDRGAFAAAMKRVMDAMAKC
mmetsp:Transcript_9805/g.13860  ORF Transcript_9805/g.13860 Transcript_9805/m.13860 type:complete len:194 (-) Transcript_9805:1371-1952(-)